jgi:Fe-S cluster biosynthesis and repair protein YggX
MDLLERIANFENMTTADPENEMAHFSLGNAYMEAGRFADAAAAFQRCTELVPTLSKAYQLGGDALIRAGFRAKAVTYLQEGYRVAAEQGDRMPMNAMGELLHSIDAELPAVTTDDRPAGAAAEGGFRCQRTGRLGTQLEKPPFRGPLGEYIHEHISAETWEQWINQGTKVINELRLDFSREHDQQVYDSHMLEFLGLEDIAAKIEAGEPVS